MANAAEDILSYLRSHLPSYPFDERVDPDFVEELVEDFRTIDILEETKAFRWYYDNDPGARCSHLRVSLRRWLARAHARY